MNQTRTWRVTAINRHSGRERVYSPFHSAEKAAEFADMKRPSADWRHVKILSRQKHSRD
jgi:hypothetical protein